MPIGSSAPGLLSTEDIYKTSLGIVGWSQSILTSVGGAAALTSQTIFAVGVGYRAGRLVTRIGWQLSVAAAGTNPTGVFVGVCSATTMLMDSANLAASTAWTTTGLRTAPLSSALTIPSDGLYYHLILINGAWGTTQPTFTHGDQLSGRAQIDSAGTFIYGQIGTGQTTLPAVNAAVTLALAGSNPLITFST